MSATIPPVPNREGHLVEGPDGLHVPSHLKREALRHIDETDFTRWAFHLACPLRPSIAGRCQNAAPLCNRNRCLRLGTMAKMICTCAIGPISMGDPFAELRERAQHAGNRQRQNAQPGPAQTLR